MADTLICPDCNTPLKGNSPDGLCPTCLLKQGLDIITEISAETSKPSNIEQQTQQDKETQIFGDYELLELIDKGGMGVVYRARQKSLNRIVALKMIRSGQLATTEEIQRFKTEATAAARLDHRHIVPIYEIGEHDGIYFYSMRLIEGENLSNAIKRKKLNLRESACILSKIARAVHYAHQHGILHRDLKPTNVLLDKDGEPHLTDFGLAKLVERKDDNLTRSQAILGSAAYMSPEQASGKTADISVASDVYSLGAMLYEMLTGKPPFIGDSFVGVIHSVIENEPTRPSTIISDIDPELETICLKCLEKQPQHRYSSALDVALELERWLDGEPILARPATRFERLIKWAKRKPAIAALSGLLILVATAGLTGVVWQWQQAVEARNLAEQKAKDAATQAVRAELSSREALRNLYVSDINLAQRALMENNRGRAYELLRKHLPVENKEDIRGFEWRYLWKLTRGQEKISLNHQDFVESVIFSPGGKNLITTERGPYMYVWDIEKKKIIAKLGELDSPVARGTIFFNSDGSLLIFQTAISIYLFNTSNWVQVAQLQRANLPIFFLPDNQTVATKSFVIGTVFFETITWEPRDFSENGFSEIGTFRAVSPDGRIYLISREDDQAHHLQLWDISGKPLSNPIICHLENPTSMAVSPDGKYIAVAEWKGTLRLWDATSGSELSSWTAHESTVYTLNFSFDSKKLATGGFDQAIKLWEIPSCAHLATFYGHHNEVWSVAFSRDSKWIASGSKDSTAKLWQATVDIQENTLTNAMLPLGFSPSGNKLLALSFDKTLQMWDVVNKRLISNPYPEYNDSDRTGFAISKDANTLVVGRRSGIVDIISLKEKKLVKSFESHTEPVIWLYISDDSSRLATATAGEIKVWDLHTGSLILKKGEDESLSPGEKFSGPLLISSDGRILLGTGPGYTVELWELPSGTKISTCRGHKWTIWDAKFFPDMRFLVTAGTDGTARVWDIYSGDQVAILSGHKEVITTVAISPDAKTIVTGSTDDTVKFWSADTFQELMTLNDFNDDVGSLIFSQDGLSLAVGCFIGSGSRHNIQIWTAPSLSEIDITETKK
ncbi:MAG: protein kinase [Verrucomicrobiae bacterium]|nr:protein kinase [Verrucomicrobiae bacterium]